MEIGQTALPCALVALVSCAVKERVYVRDNDDVRKFSTQTMGVAFCTVPQRTLRHHAIADPIDLGLGAQPLA